MLMSRVLVLLLTAAFVFGVLLGRMPEVSQASITGAGQAVQLMLSIGGTLCFWSGLMEVMDRSGLSKGIARLLQPLISRLFGPDGKDEEARAASPRTWPQIFWALAPPQRRQGSGPPGGCIRWRRAGARPATGSFC